ncbi:hypothetical protein IC220_01500 [Wolbachia endosymbiont of Pentalonia nigronervosa]|jgi:hypothetical protein|uniref:hypothetical protein n=1 Tax=Wolbachia endosymbiont of Pentalonia nigronervosa TaxID=1301914 RepID=UPI00165F0CF7|nr:hypothetical protein [Wolbachia endosymbiont of Pentalonia nigronervosa]MBD0391136.1 hypothetical protein [Wolbachia endosymbiont of Pentalonia nigronervosa]
MTCNFFSQSHVHTSCCPAYAPNAHYIIPQASYFPNYHAHYAPTYTPCISNLWHHHHADNNLVLNLCCPQSKPTSKPKNPTIDRSKLTIEVNKDGNLVHAITKADSNYKQKECMKKLKKVSNGFIISGGKVTDKCEDSESCSACLKAVNYFLRYTCAGDKKPSAYSFPFGE